MSVAHPGDQGLYTEYSNSSSLTFPLSAFNRKLLSYPPQWKGSYGKDASVEHKADVRAMIAIWPFFKTNCNLKHLS